MKLTDQEQVVLKAIGHGVAQISRVIKAVGYPKATTKKVLIALSNKGVVSLHRHDWPASLTPAQRKLMVKIGSNYYGAVSVRERNPKGKHLRGATAKQDRQYEHILESAKKYHHYGKRKKEVAARTVEVRQNPKKAGKGKTALKKTGKALKGFARGALSAGTQILGAGAEALNPTAKLSRWKTLEKKHQLLLNQLYRLIERDYHKAKTPQQKSVILEKKSKIEGRLKEIEREKQKLFERGAVNPKAKKKAGKRNVSRVLHAVRSKARRPATTSKAKHQVKSTRSRKNVASKRKAPTMVRHRSVAKTRKTATRRVAGRAVKKRNASRKPAAPAGTSRWVVEQANKLKARGYSYESAVQALNSYLETHTGSTDESFVRTYVQVAYGIKPKKNPSAESIRKTFAGSVSGSRDLFFPQGTPQGLAKLGKLVSITTEEGTIKPIAGTAWLCADTKEKLHIGSTSPNPLFDGPKRSFGKVSKVEYEGSKPHLGYKGPIIWFHHLGEESGHKPTLHADGKGGLVFRGGKYRLTKRGIEN